MHYMFYPDPHFLHNIFYKKTNPILHMFCISWYRGVKKKAFVCPGWVRVLILGLKLDRWMQVRILWCYLNPNKKEYAVLYREHAEQKIRQLVNRSKLGKTKSTNCKYSKYKTGLRNNIRSKDLLSHYQQKFRIKLHLLLVLKDYITIRLPRYPDV